MCKRSTSEYDEVREIWLSPAEPLPPDTVLEGTIETRELGGNDTDEDEDW
jgi:hypothetical protein